MVRRSFRRGLRLGLLIGLGFAVVKMLKTYRAAEEPPAHAPSPSPWPPPRPTPAAAPAAAPAPAPAPAAPAPTVERVEETPPAPHVPDAGPGGEIAESAPRQRPLRAADPSTRRPAKRAAAKKKAPPAARVWVEPTGTVCPPSHPIKAKLSSKLFHLPGMLAYDRCKPDRCYAEEAAAVADGLQKAKR